MTQRSAGFFCWLVAGCCLLCAIYFVAPLGGRFGEALLGSALFQHDSILVAGILEWGYRTLWTRPGEIFQWTAGFPVAGTLAATENLLGWQWLYSPLRAAGAPVAASYNVLVLLSLVISAVGAAMLARRLGAERWGMAVAGVGFAFAPFHLNHMLHLQTLSICWAPWLLWAADRWLESGTRRDGWGLSLLFVQQALSGMYLGVFSALLLPVYAGAGWKAGRWRWRREHAGSLPAVVLPAALLLAPVLWTYARFLSEYPPKHSTETLRRFSLEATAFLKPPVWQWAYEGTPVKALPTHWGAAFPGLVMAALWCLWLRRGRGNREGRLMLGMALLTTLLAMGPLLQIRQGEAGAGGLPLPGALLGWLPGIRWPMRLHLYSVLFSSVLAGLALTTLSSRGKQWLAAAALLGLAVEFRPAPWYAEQSAGLRAPLELSAAYPFLAGEADRGGVAEWPTALADGYATPMQVQYVYASAGHLRRIIAIHGTVRPPIVDELRQATERAPERGALDTLRRAGCTRLVIHRRHGREQEAERRVAECRAAGLTPLFEAKDAVVFELEPAR